MKSSHPACKICSRPADLFFADGRTFYKCRNCYLIFTNETISAKEQDNHFRSQVSNDPSYWQRVANTYIQLSSEFINPRQILDFGSGSGDLSGALKDMGYIVYSFEPRVHGEFTEQKYHGRFDMIIANQVIEHLPDPVREIRALHEVLDDEGILFMTSSFTDHFIHADNASDHFKNWWFKDDATHVSFFCYWSLQSLCDLVGLKIVGYGPIAAIMRKQLPE